MVKIASLQNGINIISVKPSFKYSFKEANSPQEIIESDAKKILKNSNFYISKEYIKKPKKVAQNKPKDEKTWSEVLIAINGIGKKTAEDIIAVYPTKGSLLEAFSSKAKIPFRDDYVKILDKEFIN